MITKADFSPTLLNNTTQNLLKMVEDFANAFYKLYGHAVDKETIKQRLQALDYICFEDSPTNIENNLIELAKDCNASWDPTKRQITLNPKLTTKPDQLKLALFHELVHAVSHHPTNEIENNQNTAQNTQEDTFDEIMTEYYANQIFQQAEGHAYQPTKLPNDNIYTITKDNHAYHVQYNGMAYEEYGQIGGFYDFFFGESLLRARHFTQDEQNFISQFNRFFQNTNLAPSKNFNHNTAYENFIYEKDPLKRFDTVLEMTSALLTQRKPANVLKNFNLKNIRDLRRKINTYLPFDKDNTYETKLKIALEQSTQQNTQQTIQQNRPPKAITQTQATA